MKDAGAGAARMERCRGSEELCVEGGEHFGGLGVGVVFLGWVGAVFCPRLVRRGMKGRFVVGIDQDARLSWLLASLC